MSAKKARICVVIPAYNEAPAIKGVVKNVIKAMDKTPYTYEVVVINDSSIDQTAAEAKKGGATVVNHILNSGAGGATATGLSYAYQNNYDYAVTMDADGQHLPDDVVTGIQTAQAKNTDLLIGSRLIDSAGMSRAKIIGNKGLSMITYSLFGVRVTDSQSGLRIFSSHALKNLRWKTAGYEFCSEMVWRAKQLNLTISEYPITAVYTDYSKSKGQNNWNAINIIKSLVKRRFTEMFE